MYELFSSDVYSVTTERPHFPDLQRIKSESPNTIVYLEIPWQLWQNICMFHFVRRIVCIFQTACCLTKSRYHKQHHNIDSYVL